MEWEYIPEDPWINKDSVLFKMTAEGLLISGNHTLKRQDIHDLTQKLFDLLKLGELNKIPEKDAQ